MNYVFLRMASMSVFAFVTRDVVERTSASCLVFAAWKPDNLELRGLCMLIRTLAT